MIKIIWDVVLFVFVVYIPYHDKHTKECTNAGGISVLAVDKPVCLHPSAVIELESDKENTK